MSKPCLPTDLSPPVVQYQRKLACWISESILRLKGTILIWYSTQRTMISFHKDHQSVKYIFQRVSIREDYFGSHWSVPDGSLTQARQVKGFQNHLENVKQKQEPCHFLLELTTSYPGHRFHLGSEKLIQNYMNCVTYQVKDRASSWDSFASNILWSSTLGILNLSFCKI